MNGKKKCPVCDTLVVNLPRHVSGKHKWSKEKARTVSSVYSLKKSYEWKGEKPTRVKKNQKEMKPNEKKKDYHKKKWCPVEGCLTVTVKLARHLKAMHTMNDDTEYREYLKNAQTYLGTLLPREIRKRRDEERRKVMSCLEVTPDLREENEIADLREDVATDIVVTDRCEKVMSLFLAYLLSLDAGVREKKSSLQTVREVRTILNYLGGKLENLLDPVKIREDFFKNYLDLKRKPGTSKHYVSSLISFIDYAIVEDLQIDGHSCDDYTAMKLRFCNWRKTYGRLVEDKKWEFEEELRDVLVTPEQLAIFEQGELARNAIKLFALASENVKFQLGMLEYTNVRDYMFTTIALLNAHRSGVSSNMTLKEFKCAKEDEKSHDFLIRVMNHKTRRFYGPAVVVLPKQKYELLKIFVEVVRSKITTSSDLVFLSWNGKPMQSGGVSKQINSIWKRSGVYGDNTPPKRNLCTNIIRKSVTTLVHDHEDERIQQPVADLLAHDLNTAKKIYRVKDREIQAMKGTRAINMVMHPKSQMVESESSPCSKHQRKAWTKEEESVLRDVYGTFSEVLPIETVREKLDLLCTNRTAKQVYDKLRTLVDHQDGTLSLPPMQEGLAERINRLVPLNSADFLMEEESVIAPSTRSLNSSSKLFLVEEIEQIRNLTQEVIVSGSISVERIERALQLTAEGMMILKTYKMAQIQSRVKYERRQLRSKNKH